MGTKFTPKPKAFPKLSEKNRSNIHYINNTNDIDGKTLQKINDFIANRRLEKALGIIDKQLNIFPRSIRLLQLKAVIFSQQNNHEAALLLFKEIFDLEPTLPSSFSNYGLALEKSGMVEMAIQVYGEGLKVAPKSASLNHNLAVALAGINRTEEALKYFKAALTLKPEFPEALNNFGKALIKLKRQDEAYSCFQLATKFSPNFSEAWFNQAIILKENKNIAEAEILFSKLVSNFPENLFYCLNWGMCLLELQKIVKAKKIFEDAISKHPNVGEAHLAMGALQRAQGNISDAILSLEKAISLNEKLADNFGMLALCYQQNAEFDKAEQYYKKALQIEPESVNILNNFGQFYHEIEKYDQAFQTFLKAHKNAIPNKNIVSSLYYSAANMCDWSQTKIIENTFPNLGVNNNERVNPFVMLQYEDNPSNQFLRAIHSVKYYTREPLDRRPRQQQSEESRQIKVAYFSADFHNHATMRLMSGLLKNHDKTQFKIYTFMYGKSKSDNFTDLTKQYSDQFFDISKMSDQETVDLVDSLNIDIAIDLKGYTKESRSHLFSYRLAPIQINYLGYPNTMGADFIDYIVADKTIIPQRLKSYYTEKILYMPGCYQPNDIERKIADTGMMRSDLGISENSFVMGCLNTNYKITNKEFDAWFSILKNIENSVLILLATNKWAVENIYAAARRRNISQKRIKFVPKIGYENHLERLKLVDVFVDTFRVNAHTTASDALWVGTPVVSLIGEQFAARVAASLLKTVGLDELITKDIEEYKSKIIELGNNESYLAKVREKLEKAKMSSLLFDTQKYTRHFEALLKKADENQKKNLKISDIEIE